MGKGGGSSPRPDPKIGEAALATAKTGEAWLSFAKDAFAVSNERQAELDALTKQVTESQLGLAQDQLDWSRQDRERYEETFRPIEDQFVQDATEYASEERQDAAAAEAMADVQGAAAAQRATAEREAIGLGINPASGRFAGIQRSGELGTALATAGAANTARQGVRDKGLALKADVVNLGRGLPAQSAQAASVGLGAGGQAVGLNQANQGLYNSSVGMVGQGYQGAMQGHQAQASILQNQHNSELQAWQHRQNTQSQNILGLGQAMGGIAGLFMSDENLKEDKQEIPEGEALDAVRKAPAERWRYKEGVADEGEHIGPYAGDIADATGQGDGKAIAVQDMLGLHHKAIEDLDEKVDRIAEAVGLNQSQPEPRKAKAKGKPRRKAVPVPTAEPAAAVQPEGAMPVQPQTHPEPHPHPEPDPAQVPGLGLRRAA